MNLKEYLLKQEAEIPRIRGGSGPNPEKQKELHDKIKSGEIDIGPMPDHSAPVKDKRPNYNGEEAWTLHLSQKGFNGSGNLSGLRDLPMLRSDDD